MLLINDFVQRCESWHRHSQSFAAIVVQWKALHFLICKAPGWLEELDGLQEAYIFVSYKIKCDSFHVDLLHIVR